MVVWNGPRGMPKITAADLEYSGNMLFTSDGENWEAVLLDGAAATLRFKKNPGLVDIFMVAGGQSASYYAGAEQNAYSGPSHGCPGGAGGECVTLEAVKLEKETDYTVSIGGSDQDTTINLDERTYRARSGYGSAGGVGATVSSSGTIVPANGDDGVFAYGEDQDTLLIDDFAGHKFGPGGGGGGAHLGSNGAFSGAGLGGESNGSEHQHGKGGRYLRGYPGSANGADGYANHGQGGGGPAYWWMGSASRYGDGTENALGKGGSGVMFIRGHRRAR